MFPQHKGADYKTRPPYILVACPTYDGKQYCFQKWIDRVKSLTWSHYDIFVVDNSATPDFFEKYRQQIPMYRQTFGAGEKDDAMYRVCRSMARIQKYFLSGRYDFWLNIEADVIPPANVTEVLLQYSGGDADWVQHCYPSNGDPAFGYMQGIGCALFSRRLMTDFDWSDVSIADDAPDSELWAWTQPRLDIYRVVELWGVMQVEHLKQAPIYN